ncbi:histidinol-phosphate phosphatase family protein [Syntrophobotulus glycolicus DSM 8271]|uniref:Histidinol-phosphate phosphatase family protein n=1 Tax=Syntrophobotulus glycolicus (strain DSM 8271 / FlGlyR) TaxID=645991 RepID=F0SX35_SYNGF|nr:HAD-IIIA family hydrolase [Syntrophobotulus glycolicus]ADY55818.1 histidinol-phosphate phosphatase family protein [Syntrophobotulus glycolicus DSM 8271]
MKVVITAGGRGTRISAVHSRIPKPMIPVLGKPVLEHQIECLHKQGFTDITVTVGYLSHTIQTYFGNGDKRSPATGKPFGVHLSYVAEEEPLGTAGALYWLRDKCKEDFLLLNGDIIFDIDINRFYQFHRDKKGLATLFTHPNSHPYDSGIIVTDQESRVKRWLHSEDVRMYCPNRVNAGLHILSPEILSAFATLQKRDLDRDILQPLIATGRLYAYDSPEYVKDMGTPERLSSVSSAVRTGIVGEKNLSNRQRAVFLDRDGIINKHVGFLTSIEDFALMDNVADAIRKINDSGYLAIVVTNQPVIARGELSPEGLQEIHHKMETLLGRQGAYIDALYYCPHHPRKGFAGERPELKIHCDCRKPKPGMLRKAAQKFNIDLSRSWMIGDSESDIQAGLSAGCQVCFIGEEPPLNAKSFPTLYDCICTILDR